MYDHTSLLEQLKQAARSGLSLRDRLLEIAEDLESPDKERVQQTARKLVTFGTKLREIAAELPTGPEADDIDEEEAAEFRARIEAALENYLEDAMDDLEELVEEREAREAKEREGGK